MTNEQKAVKLEEMAANREADSRGLHDLAEKLGLTELQKQKAATIAMADADAALLREAAGMMRERATVQWVYTDTDRSRMTANYKGWMIHAYPSGWWCCLLDSQIQTAMEDVRTLPAAQAAAVAWVDEQEGK